MLDIDSIFLADSHDMGHFLNGSPGAISLNGKVVAVHLNSEKTAFAPVSSPAISAHPELNAILFAPSNYSDLVIDSREQFGL